MKKKQKFEGKIEAITSSEPFYMVVVEEGVFPPKNKHLNYEDAFAECLRLSKKENKNWLFFSRFSRTCRFIFNSRVI